MKTTEQVSAGFGADACHDFWKSRGICGFSGFCKNKNNLALGDVNISLKEYRRKNQREYPYQNPQIVLPGDTVSKIPRITNKAEPCWVRVWLGFSEIDNHKKYAFRR